MKQITQSEFIKLIEEKQENAKNMFYSTKDSEKDFREAKLKAARCLAEMDTYQDLICYLNDVEIVPEAKQESLNKYTQPLNKEEFEQKVIIEPFQEALKKVTPLRNDRIREFKEKDGDITYIDGKEIVAIEIDRREDCFITIRTTNYNFIFYKKEFDCNDIVEWWKYWKQN